MWKAEILTGSVSLYDHVFCAVCVSAAKTEQRKFFRSHVSIFQSLEARREEWNGLNDPHQAII